MKKLLSTTIAVGIMASMSMIPASAMTSVTLPTGAVSADNSALITTNGSNMNVKMNVGQGGVGTVNYGSFNVGSDAAVNFEFTAHNQTSLNRVDAAGGLSQIYGKITSSGCAGCGYDATGKVILINPNGVLFGNGANVNLNSFTVSTMDGTYDKATNTLKLSKDATAAVNGKYKGQIYVGDKTGGANIYGDKGVTFAADDVYVYNGSKISTNIGNNVGDAAFGKIKIVTSDGVNFTYYNNGAVSKISGVKNSAENQTISVNGELVAGNIDIRNHSSNAASEINLNHANLKAVKAVKGNDGNIWLTANNKVVIDNSRLTTANAAGTEAVEGGNLKVLAGQKASVKGSNINAVGDINITAQNAGADAVIDSSIVKSLKNVNLKANRIASIQNGSEVTADNITVDADAQSQVNNSKLVANKTININSLNNVWVEKANLNASKINITAVNGTVDGDADLNNQKTEITAGKDVDVVLANVGNRNNGLIAKAGNNMTVSTDGTLSVSSLISGNDMKISAQNVISGYGKTENVLRNPGDSADRAYIEVGGEFTSNPAFEVTDSADLTADGAFNKRHHIQYGANGEEKILLVNKRPYVAPIQPVDPQPPVVEPDNGYTIDEDQAQMLNKLPRQPETYSNVANINNGRTTFVDVFAAASQIEIEDDEEE